MTKLKTIPLSRWIWRSYAKTALIPLLLVEVVLIAIYIQTNYWSRQENITILREEATETMQRIARQEAENVSRQLNAVTQLTEVYRQQTAQALATPSHPGVESPTRYRFSADGVYYSPENDGGSAVFYSGVKPIGEAEKEKVRRIAILDSLMKHIKTANPLIVQLYLNTHDSLNHIYPFIDVLQQYSPHMDIPTYNFYYEADEKHNPERVPVWTDVYLDPAGQGWMASCIAPVYQGDFLEGVVGLDITVDVITRYVLDIKLPWGAYAVLVGKNGSLLAMPFAGEQDFGIKEIGKHDYVATIKQDTFKPESFDLYKRPELSPLITHISSQTSGLTEAYINGERLVSWHRVKETGWTFMVITTPNKIFNSVLVLSHRLEMISYLMIFALLVFYCLFFLALFIRARKASRSIAAPLEQIDAMMQRIGQGAYEQPILAFNVSELHETAQNLRLMGMDLGAANRRLLDTQQQLQEHVYWLNSVFQLSPDGLVTFDRKGLVSQSNPAFFNMTGFTREHVASWSINTLWRELTQLTSISSLHTNLVFKKNTDFRIELVRPSPRSLRCHVCSFNEEIGDNNEEHSLIAYFRDITQETEVEHMKSQFLATAAHELRTPLTTIMGYSELLAENEFELSVQRELLSTILENSRNLVAIVGDLLDLARIESRAGRDFNILPQALIPVVKEAIKASGLHNQGGRLIFNSSIDDDLTINNRLVAIDAEKFKQALLNVLKNADKFSPLESLINVNIRSRQLRNELELGVEIIDQGIGMTKEQVTRIFERFFRGDTSGKNSGTGLGMSIVKEIMDIHYGIVEIESNLGHGSRITLWLKAINPDTSNN